MLEQDLLPNPVETETIIEKAPIAKTEKKPFDCCFEGTVPPVLYALLERIKNPELYRLPSSEIPYQPNFYMLYGGSRTGKTFLVDAFIKEVGAASVCRTGGELSLGLNETISKITAMFQEARERAEAYGSCIIWIDECEPAFISRNAMTLNNQAFHGASTLWKKIDEHRRSHPNILVVAATNLFESIDEAARKRVAGTAIQIPFEESSLPSYVWQPHSSQLTEEKFLKILNNYRRVPMTTNWHFIICCLSRLDDGLIADVAESAVRYALDDYYKERKPEKLKELETEYFQLKKYIADNNNPANNNCAEELMRLSQVKEQLNIITAALHADALGTVIVRQSHITEALAAVFNNFENSKPSLLKQANELAKEYWPLISTASGLIGLVMSARHFLGTSGGNNINLAEGGKFLQAFMKK
jgi:SpoVK/Ycf46/Vps4 family AAA+-type ATPase